MSKYLVRGETLTAIADAIRSKTGKTNAITLNDFVTEIEQVDYREVIDSVPSVSGTLTYNGSAQSPTLLAYNPDQLMMTGISSATNAGTYEMAFSPKEGYKWADNTTAAKVVEWSIAKVDGSLSLSATSGTIEGKGVTKTFTVTRDGDGEITAVSSNASIAAVSVSGTTVTITSKGYGSATITISIAEGTNHTAPSNKTYSVTVNYLYLYNAGDENTSVTGGWVTEAKAYHNGSVAVAAKVTKDGSSITVKPNGDGGCILYTKNKISLKDYNKIVFNVKVSGATAYDTLCNMRVWSSIGTYSASNVVATSALQYHSSGSVTLDVSSLTGSYNIGFGLYASGTVTLNSMRLE